MILGFLIILLILALSILVIPRLVTAFHARTRLYTLEDAPAKKVAIVFGAGLWRDGSPTPVLRDRVATAANLYFAGVVEKILMSGDNVRTH
jgi:SanA protein